MPDTPAPRPPRSSRPARPTPLRLTPHAVRACLTAAGHRLAQFHRSAQVRGWGSWTDGVQVASRAEPDGRIRVEYRSDAVGARGRVLDEDRLTAPATALEARGYRVERRATPIPCLLVALPAAAA